MKVIDLSLMGAKLIVPKVFHDERGFFRETYRKPLYEQVGIDVPFVQDNHSFSKGGTLRGMHFQTFPGQAKLVSVMVGKIYDVFVDIRPESPTFGKWEGIELDDVSGQQLFIPVGFAHGFYVMSESAHVTYKVSAIYNPETEKSFRYDDPEVGIQWPNTHPLVSLRDLSAPSFRQGVPV